MDWLKILVIDGAMLVAVDFSIRPDILSGPLALEIFRNLRISLSVHSSSSGHSPGGCPKCRLALSRSVVQSYLLLLNWHSMTVNLASYMFKVILSSDSILDQLDSFSRLQSHSWSWISCFWLQNVHYKWTEISLCHTRYYLALHHNGYQNCIKAEASYPLIAIWIVNVGQILCTIWSMNTMNTTYHCDKHLVVRKENM